MNSLYPRRVSAHYRLIKKEKINKLPECIFEILAGLCGFYIYLPAESLLITAHIEM